MANDDSVFFDARVKFRVGCQVYPAAAQGWFDQILYSGARHVRKFMAVPVAATLTTRLMSFAPAPPGFEAAAPASVYLVTRREVMSTTTLHCAFASAAAAEAAIAADRAQHVGAYEREDYDVHELKVV